MHLWVSPEDWVACKVAVPSWVHRRARGGLPCPAEPVGPVPDGERWKGVMFEACLGGTKCRGVLCTTWQVLRGCRKQGRMNGRLGCDPPQTM